MITLAINKDIIITKDIWVYSICACRQGVVFIEKKEFLSSMRMQNGH